MAHGSRGRFQARRKLSRLAIVRLEDRIQPSAYYTPPTNFQMNPDYDKVVGRIGSQQPVDIALTYLNQHSAEFGATAADLADAKVTRNYTDSESGTTYISFRQQVNGLEVRDTDLSVSVLANGAVFTASGGFVPSLKGRINAEAARTTLSPLDAVRSAATELGLSLDIAPFMVSPINIKATTYSIIAPSTSMENIKAQWQYVPTPDGRALRAWELIIQTTDSQHWYDLAVNATTGSIVALADWIDNDSYSVLPSINESLQDGGFSVVTNPANPTASPFGWHDTNGAAGAESFLTIGNNVDAHLDRDANNIADSNPTRPNGGTSLNFGGYTFDAASAPSVLQNENAAVVNLFYMNNSIHDIYYRYGFTEAAGNFQTNNYGKGGAGNDAVQADAQDGSGTNNANFGTPGDGSAPRMQMYEWTSASPDRDSDLDNGVIIHEYTHGLSTRLTPGSPNGLNNSQSGGMGEGWGDFYAMMILQKPTDTQNAAYGMGTYLLAQPQTGTGIRRFAYSFNMSIDPLTFDAYGSSGTTSYGVTRSTEVHDSGELWATTLWDMNWLLINKYGYDPNVQSGWSAGPGPARAGNKLAMKLVMDAMKLQPSNPSFTQARDAIIAADVALNGGADRFEIWSAFARRGLGANASVGASSSTANITPDFTLPMVVASVNPATDAVVTVNPASYVLNVPSAITGATLQASDFVVNGQAATGVSYTAGATSATFTFTIDPVTTAGPQSITISAGAFTRASDGSPVTAFSSNFYVDATPLHVTSLTPTPNTVVSAVPLTTIDVNLDGPVDPASVQNSDLSITQGTVTGFSLLNSNTTVRFNVSNLVNEGAKFYVYVAAGAFTDLNGNPNAANAGGTYTLDYSTAPFPTPLVQRYLAGSMVYDGSLSGSVGFAGDTDIFTLDLEGGQTANVVITPSSSLRPSLQVSGPGTLLSASANTPGQIAQLQLVSIATAGTYTFTVSGLASTIGAYALQVTLNQVEEAESSGGSQNGTLATAQNINAAFTSTATGVSRAAIHGRSDVAATAEVETNNSIGTATAVSTASSTPTTLYQMGYSGTISSSSDADYVNIGTMQVGDILTITESGSPSLRGTNTDPLVRLYRAGTAGNIVNDDDSGPGLDALIYRYTVTVADTYYIRAYRANTTNTGSYQIAVLLENTSTAPSTGGTFTAEVEPNESTGTANNASNAWRPVKYDIGAIGSVSAGDTDYFAYQFTAGDLVSITTDSTSTLSPQMALLDSVGTVLTTEDGTSSIAGASGISPIYGYNITTTGTYYVRVSGVSGTTGSYITDVLLSTPGTLAVSPPAKDLYAFPLTAGQSVSAALKNITAGNLDIAILDTTGAVAATGTTGSTNLDEIVSDYVASTAGTYYLQVTGVANLEYQVVVVTGGTYDREANDSFATAQPMGGNNAAEGYVSSGNTDWYQINLAAGDSITIATGTPGGSSGEFVNNVDPYLELYDPSNNLIGSDNNSAPDGKNAILTQTASIAGSYRVRVIGASNTSGEYSVRATVDAGSAPLNVSIDQAIGQADPTNSSTIHYTVVFSSPVTNFATGDVSLSGTAGATTALVTGGGTTYDVAVSGMTSSGTVIATIAAGMASSGASSNNASTSTDNSVTYDNSLPTGSSSPADVTTFGGNSYTFTVTFTDNVAVSVASLDGNDVRVTGPGGLDVPAAFVSVDVNSDGTPRTATYSFTPPGGTWDNADNGAYNVVLQGGQLLDTAGNAAATATVGNFNVNVPSASKLTAVQVNDGSAQRSRVTSLLLTFDSAVVLPAIPADAFQLKRQSDNAIVGLSAAPSGNMVALTFTSGPVDFGSLADGRYTLTAFASQINGGNFDGDSNGVAGGDYQLVGDPATAPKLFRLYGDVDGNGLVDGVDFGAFRTSFNTNNSTFDFDGSSIVDGTDFGQFRARFGVVI